MYQALLADVRFHQLLLKFDHDMADAARGQGCSCGGVLHSARYRRKPRGLPTGLDKKAAPWMDAVIAPRRHRCGFSAAGCTSPPWWC